MGIGPPELLWVGQTLLGHIIVGLLFLPHLVPLLPLVFTDNHHHVKSNL